MFQTHDGELALSPALLEEVKRRLEQTVVQIMEVIMEEEVGHRAAERLGRLRDLSAFPKTEPAAGDVNEKESRPRTVDLYLLYFLTFMT